MILHLDLQRIVADEKIRMTVPIHFLNEEDAPGVKEGGSVCARHDRGRESPVCLPTCPSILELDVGETGTLDAVTAICRIFRYPPASRFPILHSRTTVMSCRFTSSRKSSRKKSRSKAKRPSKAVEGEEDACGRGWREACCRRRRQKRRRRRVRLIFTAIAHADRKKAARMRGFFLG